MAPTYKPLPVEPSQWIPEEVFNQPRTTYDQAQAAQAALLAKQLAVQNQQTNNQADALRLREAERIAEEDRLFREAVAQAYKAQSAQAAQFSDPGAAFNADATAAGGGLGPQPEFNPNVGWDTAKRLAMESGNIGRALEIERATDSRSIDEPISDSTRAVIEPLTGPLPPGITKRDLDLREAIRRGDTYATSVKDTRERAEDKNERLLPEGWEGNPTYDDSRKFKTVLSGVGKVEGILNDLEASIKRSGPLEVGGPEYVLQRQLIGDLALELKSPAFGNLGAALSPSEYELLLTQLPRLIASPETSVAKVLVEQGLGRDAFDAINAIKRKISRVIDVEAPIRNMWRKGSRDGTSTGTSGRSSENPMGGQATPTPPRPDLQFKEMDAATGLPVYKKSR